MKWSKTLTAMVMVLVLSGVAAVMEVQGRQVRKTGAVVSAAPAPPVEAPGDAGAAVPTLPVPLKGSAHPITG